MSGRRAVGGDGDGGASAPLLPRGPAAWLPLSAAAAWLLPAACCMWDTAGADSGLRMAAACWSAHRSLEERRRRPWPPPPQPPRAPRPGMLIGALHCRALPGRLPLPEAPPSLPSSSAAAALARSAPRPAEPLPLGRGALLPPAAARPSGAAMGKLAGAAVRGGLANGGRPLGEPTANLLAELDSWRSMAGRETCSGGSRGRAGFSAGKQVQRVQLAVPCGAYCSK